MKPEQRISTTDVFTAPRPGNAFDAATDIEPGEHVMGAFMGKTDGPTLIVVGSLHGNEPGGAAALFAVSKDLESLAHRLYGRAYFLVGNTRALLAGRRFIDTDLNRSWTRDNLSSACGRGRFTDTSECLELNELVNTIDSILITAKDEVYVVDLHSTSASGTPFATVGDTLRNREFAQKFPVPILLGIEEQLDGTLLEYLNDLGTVTFGFEGGSHLAAETVENHKALVWHALKNAGILDASDMPETVSNNIVGVGEKERGRIYEVLYRRPVKPGDGFVMRPGYNNFDPIRRGDVLAHDNRGPIEANRNGLILMPLYQKLGADGFFIGREISPFWLWLSGVLRRWRLQDLVQYLPGVSQDPNDPATLIVNTSIARLFPLQIFHLLGFRRRRWVDKKLVVSRRRHDTSGPFKYRGK